MAREFVYDRHRMAPTDRLMLEWYAAFKEAKQAALRSYYHMLVSSSLTKTEMQSVRLVMTPHADHKASRPLISIRPDLDEKLMQLLSDFMHLFSTYSALRDDVKESLIALHWLRNPIQSRSEFSQMVYSIKSRIWILLQMCELGSLAFDLTPPAEFDADVDQMYDAMFWWSNYGQQ